MADYADSILYREEKYSRRALRACILGGISLLIFLIEAGISLALEGTVGAVAGAFGISAFLLSFAGMVLGLKSFHDLCRSFLLCKVGTLLCGIMVAIWFLVFCAGIS